jgi:hypothetical protein
MWLLTWYESKILNVVHSFLIVKQNGVGTLSFKKLTFCDQTIHNSREFRLQNIDVHYTRNSIVI